jgi:23S rRNA pseudouridine2605 synthase
VSTKIQTNDACNSASSSRVVKRRRDGGARRSAALTPGSSDANVRAFNSATYVALTSHPTTSKPACAKAQRSTEAQSTDANYCNLVVFVVVLVVVVVVVVAECSSMSVRVSKFLASANVVSRRAAEQLVVAGHVAINGVVCREPAVARVAAHDVVQLADGRRFVVDAARAFERPRLWLHHKRRARLVSEHDPAGRACLLPLLAAHLARPRILAVGRLDFNTEGLLLLTNHAPLKRHLELPATAFLRLYHARLFPADNVTTEVVDKLERGVLDFGSISVRRVSNQPVDSGSSLRAAWFEVGLYEGKNREIKRALEVFEIQTSRLIRVSFGKFKLGELRPGGILEVSSNTVDSICRRLGTAAGMPPTAVGRSRARKPKQKAAVDVDDDDVNDDDDDDDDDDVNADQTQTQNKLRN